ncbi:MAG: hypothetical protein LBR54_01675 [Oscillospiraceae bacterium]|jgi:hypothetical protein|nr:hypothetical protein [Oscillospiraceae bacterium]
MGILKKTGVKIAAGALSLTVLTSATFAAISYVQYIPSGNPWDYTLFSSGENEITTRISGETELNINGNIRSNGSVSLDGKNIAVSGIAMSAGNVFENADSVSIGKKIENAEQMELPDIFENLLADANELDNINVIKGDYVSSSLYFEGPYISDTDINIDISAMRKPPAEEITEGKGKIGAFGADFLANVYGNQAKLASILPVFDSDLVIEPDSNGKTDLLKLGDNSNFIPVAEQSVSGNWSNSGQLPGAVFQDNFNQNHVPERINELKKNNPVFSACQSGATAVQCGYGSESVNPESALGAKKITAAGGNITLNGEYANLEELKIENNGGTQLIGSYPNLKYIYKTAWGNLNLAGNFPSLECIYTPGGQLLLGTGDTGFNTDGATVINENGSIIIYTEKDISITNSEVITPQTVAVRGAGKTAAASEFNAENTVKTRISVISKLSGSQPTELLLKPEEQTKLWECMYKDYSLIRNIRSELWLMTTLTIGEWHPIQ